MSGESADGGEQQFVQGFGRTDYLLEYDTDIGDDSEIGIDYRSLGEGNREVFCEPTYTSRPSVIPLLIL